MSTAEEEYAERCEDLSKSIAEAPDSKALLTLMVKAVEDEWKRAVKIERDTQAFAQWVADVSNDPVVVKEALKRAG